MNEFTPKPVDLNPGDLADADVEFFEVDFYPAVYVNSSARGELGAVALFGETRTFPVSELYSYNASQLSEEAFFEKFPGLAVFFTKPEKQAA